MLLKISNEYASAVADINNSSIGVFPNPIEERLNIKISKETIINKTRVHITNMLGETVFTKFLTKHETQIFLSLEQGIYVIQVINNQKVIYHDKLLVVEK
ncbi:MAG TPA: T9SS type A sorting domain-containing protein [Lutibacter sp.]|nr:T9SS type A sorting domain-containing protein [Lutibacter sp.]